jgi:hypothetical protein
VLCVKLQIAEHEWVKISDVSEESQKSEKSQIFRGFFQHH